NGEDTYRNASDSATSIWPRMGQGSFLRSMGRTSLLFWPPGAIRRQSPLRCVPHWSAFPFEKPTFETERRQIGRAIEVRESFRPWIREPLSSHLPARRQ